jgi:hypothetical protein
MLCGKEWGVGVTVLRSIIAFEGEPSGLMDGGMRQEEEPKFYPCLWPEQWIEHLFPNLGDTG